MCAHGARYVPLRSMARRTLIVEITLSLGGFEYVLLRAFRWKAALNAAANVKRRFGLNCDPGATDRQI